MIHLHGFLLSTFGTMSLDGVNEIEDNFMPSIVSVKIFRPIQAPHFI